MEEEKTDDTSMKKRCKKYKKWSEQPVPYGFVSFFHFLRFDFSKPFLVFNLTDVLESRFY